MVRFEPVTVTNIAVPSLNTFEIVENTEQVVVVTLLRSDETSASDSLFITQMTQSLTQKAVVNIQVATSDATEDTGQVSVSGILIRRVTTVQKQNVTSETVLEVVSTDVLPWLRDTVRCCSYVLSVTTNGRLRSVVTVQEPYKTV